MFALCFDPRSVTKIMLFYSFAKIAGARKKKGKKKKKKKNDQNL